METIPKVRSIRREPKQVTRCAGSTKEQASLSAIGTASDGFLRHHFAPLFEQGKKVPEKESTERGFFKSLSILSTVYGFELSDFSDKPYPYNILLAHGEAKSKLKALGQSIDLFIVKDKQEIVNLRTDHWYDTGMTLYYIPVLRLYRLLQDKKQKQTAELLLSVFAYLFHIAGVPYYREEYTDLYYNYMCLEEWAKGEWQDCTEEELNSNRSEYNSACHYGDIMQRKIYNLYHLNHFQERIDRYNADTPFKCGCLNVARRAMALMQEYPDTNIFGNTSNENFDEDDMYIRAEQYISFIGDTEGALYENISQMVNSEFGECGEKEQPTLKQIYGQDKILPKKGLDFENRIFPMILNLCTILYELP